MRLIDALPHHVIDRRIDAVHRGGRSLTVVVGADGLNAGGDAEDFLQTCKAVNLAIACLQLVVRGYLSNVGCPLVVDAGGLYDF